MLETHLLAIFLMNQQPFFCKASEGDYSVEGKDTLF